MSHSFDSIAIEYFVIYWMEREYLLNMRSAEVDKGKVAMLSSRANHCPDDTMVPVEVLQVLVTHVLVC